MRGLGLLLLVAACGHSEPFATAPTASDGPFSDAAPIRLTYNTSTDSSLSLTQDGQGMLYLHTTQAGTGDRCVGLLPLTGGTRRWELCDTRAQMADSANSFSAPAVGTDGRLLYVQGVSRRGLASVSRARLWLADTSMPFVRREIFSFPANIAGRGVSWLADAQWIGPDAFVARAGLLNATQNCAGNCPWDTTFVGAGIVRGTITSTGATLTAVLGAETALAYSLAEQGTTLVVVTSPSTITRVPIGGGTQTLLPLLPTLGTISGIGCHLSACVVTQWAPRPPPASGDDTRFFHVGLAPTTVTLVRTELGRWYGPVLLPSGGDVAVQSSTGPTRDLYLFKGLIP
ncbi:MAG: hypothetical protein SFU84_02890 [Gemmatimonadales bacterium]|nr:hypothetical protein [Gemmatimonadales bacterium]